MIYKFEKETNRVSPCIETDFKSHKILERQNIEVWIENNPNILGEDLLIVSSEYDKFDKTNERVDLLAIDKEGYLVVIELKRDDSGKNVDLQAIKYAAYCSTMKLDDICNLYMQYKNRKEEVINSDEGRNTILNFIENEEFEEMNVRPRIILVSKVFRPEVTASVLWLRNFGLDISCVKLTPYVLGGGEIIFEANTLIPVPEAKDFLMEVEKKERSSMTVSQKEYSEFYKELIKCLKSVTGQDYSPPIPRFYYPIASGVSGIHYEWAFHGRPRSSFAVELHFERANKEWNINALEYVENNIQGIKDKINEEIKIQRDWGKNWSRIYFEINEGRFTEELKEWAIKKMVIFMNFMQPILDELKGRG